MKYYAVKKGRHPGIYNTWEECQKEVDHFKDAKFKSFDSKKEVLAKGIAEIAQRFDDLVK